MKKAAEKVVEHAMLAQYLAAVAMQALLALSVTLVHQQHDSPHLCAEQHCCAANAVRHATAKVAMATSAHVLR